MKPIFVFFRKHLAGLRSIDQLNGLMGLNAVPFPAEPQIIIYIEAVILEAEAKNPIRINTYVHLVRGIFINLACRCCRQVDMDKQQRKTYEDFQQIRHVTARFRRLFFPQALRLRHAPYLLSQLDLPQPKKNGTTGRNARRATQRYFSRRGARFVFSCPSVFSPCAAALFT